jgi:hypothetical protein
MHGHDNTTVTSVAPPWDRRLAVVSVLGLTTELPLHSLPEILQQVEAIGDLPRLWHALTRPSA